MKVMCFNIRYGTDPDEDNRWDRRSDLLFETIHEHEPDILGLQEALAFQLDEVLEALPRVAAVGRDRRGGRTDEFTPILFDAGRFSVESSGDFWLSETPEEVGSVGWDAMLPRACTWVVLADKSGSRIAVFNTHFDHRGERARIESARLVVERLGSFDEVPRLVLGDFNAGEDSPVLEALTDAGFRDTFRAIHPNDTDVGTVHRFTGISRGPKIDFILCDRWWEVADAAIVRASRDGRYPSDHFPVTAVVRTASKTEAR